MSNTRLSNQTYHNGSQEAINQAYTLLSLGKKVEAVEMFRGSPYQKSLLAQEFLRGVLFRYKSELPQKLLEDTFLDPVWCQCNICDSIWLLPPLASLSEIQVKYSSVGLECISCGRVICSACAKIVGLICKCGGTYQIPKQPNGRKQMLATSGMGLDKQESLVHPENNQSHFSLYYGFDGKVPIGLDDTLQLNRTGMPGDHVRWATCLLDRGIYLQAEQQLDILADTQESSPSINWLRARLELIKLRNSRERAHRRLDFSMSSPEWVNILTKAIMYLNKAIANDPNFGPAWLTLSQIYVEPLDKPDYDSALQCVNHAERLIGPIPPILLVKGKVLRGLGRPQSALDVLTSIPNTSPEFSDAQQELEITKLELNLNSEHIVPEECLKLGRIYLETHNETMAKAIFQRLIKFHSDRPEGYYGFAKLAFLDSTKEYSERLSESYRLCKEALAHDSKFGLAYELLGSIFRNVSSSGSVSVNFPIEDHIKCFKQAISLDPSCDVALWLLGEYYIDQGNLDQAKDLLEKSATLNTKSSSVYFILAEIYLGIRDFDKYLKYY